MILSILYFTGLVVYYCKFDRILKLAVQVYHTVCTFITKKLQKMYYKSPFLKKLFKTTIKN